MADITDIDKFENIKPLLERDAEEILERMNARRLKKMSKEDLLDDPILGQIEGIEEYAGLTMDEITQKMEAEVREAENKVL